MSSTYSKALGTGMIINNGAPASVSVQDEGVQIVSRITSLDFEGAAVQAVADAVGNVVVKVDAKAAVPDVIDGGNF